MKYGIYLNHLPLDMFTKQFIVMRKIRNNMKVKPKWMNEEIKRFIRATKKRTITDSKNKFIRDLSTFCIPGKRKLGKIKD